MQDWIFEENLRPLFRFAAEQVEYEFDDLDWDAVVQGVEPTDAEADAWFEYPLAGSRSLTVAIAHDPGSTVIHVRAEGDAEVERTLASAISLMQSYRCATAETKAASPRQRDSPAPAFRNDA